MDNATRYGGVCFRPDPEYQLLGTYVRACVRIRMYVQINQPLRITATANCEIGGLGYLKFLAPPEKILRWIEGKLNLLGRLPHYVSVDQKTYGRFGVLPTSHSSVSPPADGIGMGMVGSTQRLGP